MGTISLTAFWTRYILYFNTTFFQKHVKQLKDGCERTLLLWLPTFQIAKSAVLLDNGWVLGVGDPDELSTPPLHRVDPHSATITDVIQLVKQGRLVPGWQIPTEVTRSTWGAGSVSFLFVFIWLAKSYRFIMSSGHHCKHWKHYQFYLTGDTSFANLFFFKNIFHCDSKFYYGDFSYFLSWTTSSRLPNLINQL